MRECEMKSTTAVFVFGVLAFINVCGALTLSRVVVPSYKFYGESAVLECPFELGKNKGDRLYAVKWYFNGEEFYRYVPKYTPPILTHSVRGVHVMEGKPYGRAVHNVGRNIDKNIIGDQNRIR